MYPEYVAFDYILINCKLKMILTLIFRFKPAVKLTYLSYSNKPKMNHTYHYLYKSELNFKKNHYILKLKRLITSIEFKSKIKLVINLLYSSLCKLTKHVKIELHYLFFTCKTLSEILIFLSFKTNVI